MLSMVYLNSAKKMLMFHLYWSGSTFFLPHYFSSSHATVPLSSSFCFSLSVVMCLKDGKYITIQMMLLKHHQSCLAPSMMAGFDGGGAGLELKCRRREYKALPTQRGGKSLGKNSVFVLECGTFVHTLEPPPTPNFIKYLFKYSDCVFTETTKTGT